MAGIATGQVFTNPEQRGDPHPEGVAGLRRVCIDLRNLGSGKPPAVDPTVAQQLAAGPHTVEVRAEGGWGQWAISGWTVSHEVEPHFARTGLIAAGLLATFSIVGLLWSGWAISSDSRTTTVSWGNKAAAWPARFNETSQIAFILILAAAFYLAPERIALFFLIPLIPAILIRPDLGLALIVFGLSFISMPASLPPGQNGYPDRSIHQSRWSQSLRQLGELPQEPEPG